MGEIVKQQIRHAGHEILGRRNACADRNGANPVFVRGGDVLHRIADQRDA